jgi:secreted trypsin-like serine protease
MRSFFKLQLATLLLLVLALTLSATPAQAITGNYVADNEHPFVGLVVFYDQNGEFTHRCSGSLLTPTVFLTAGHCTDATTKAVSARIYFQQDAGLHFNPVTQVDPITGYPETCANGTLGTLCATSSRLYNYGFADFAGFPNTQDVGLILLDQPIMLSEYGSLAAPGSLDALATRRGQQNVTFTVSGYGLTRSNQPQSGKPNESYRSRLMASSTLVNLRNALTDGFNLQTNGNGAGKGGTCSGDSGGPVFYGGFSSNTIVGVTSFGLNGICRGVDFAFRTDTVAVQDWIESIVGTAEFSQINIVSI